MYFHANHRPLTSRHMGQVSFLPGIFSMARRIPGGLRKGREMMVLQRAIAQGQRDANKLASLLFYARHPERQGRRLQRGEPNFEKLRQEWLTIRDRLVRPALRRRVAPSAPGTAPPSGPKASRLPKGSRTIVINPQTTVVGKKCPPRKKVATDRCGGARIPCPPVPNMLCVSAVNRVPFEYVANGRTRSGRRIYRIRKNSSSGLIEVVDRIPNRVQRFTPDVAVALSTFLANMARFGMPVAGILTMGSYYCRCISGTQRLSNHSWGDALDITGVRWPTSGGPNSTLPDTIIHNYKSADPREKRLIRRINACLRLSFATVIDYTNRRHRDHFHCDTNRGRGRRLTIRTNLRFMQEALGLVLKRKIRITGRLDRATRKALMDFSGIPSARTLRKDRKLFNKVLDDLYTQVASGKF